MVLCYNVAVVTQREEGGLEVGREEGDLLEGLAAGLAAHLLLVCVACVRLACGVYVWYLDVRVRL